MDCSPWGVKESDKLKQLSMHCIPGTYYVSGTHLGIWDPLGIK